MRAEKDFPIIMGTTILFSVFFVASYLLQDILYGIIDPRIRVAGLNPHAGEAGYLGREEIEVIAPAVELGVVAKDAERDLHQYTRAFGTKSTVYSAPETMSKL